MIYLVGCFAVTHALVERADERLALARLDPRAAADAGGGLARLRRPLDDAWNHVRTAACGLAFLCTL